MIVTNTLLERVKTAKGGYTKKQLNALGVKWPPVHGWKKNVIGKDVSRWRTLFIEKYKSFEKPAKTKKRKDLDSRKEEGKCLQKTNPLRKLDVTYEETWIRRDGMLEKSYQEFLNSDHWKAVKKKAMSRKSTYGKCNFCGATKNLDLHHTSYKWIGTKHELNCVIALCREHHEEVHRYAKQTGFSVRISTNHLREKYKTLANKK